MKTTNTTDTEENFPLRLTNGNDVDAIQAPPISSQPHRFRGVLVLPLSAGSAHCREDTGGMGIRAQVRIAGQKIYPRPHTCSECELLLCGVNSGA